MTREISYNKVLKHAIELKQTLVAKSVEIIKRNNENDLDHTALFRDVDDVFPLYFTFITQ